MDFLTIQRLRDHCKTDGDDDSQLEFYGEAAERAVVADLDRMVFKDEAAWDAAIAAIPDAITASRLKYEARILALGEDDTIGHDQAWANYSRVRRAQHRVLDGIIINAAIEAAMLLTAGNLYRNREATVVGETAVSLPNGVDALLTPYRALGYAP